jgi:hypothetical protein
MQHLKKFILTFGLCIHAFLLLPAQLSFIPFNEIDRIAFSAPSFLGQEMGNLIHYCNNTMNNEIDKVRFYFVWSALNIRYDLEELKLTTREACKQESPHVFKNRRALCCGFANLFTDLCKSSGIAAQTIIGYVKSKEGIADDNEFHAWNAIKIDEKWYLFDLTWAANYFHTAQALDAHFDNYFLQSPQIFGERHLPFDPVWQLTEEAQSRNAFFTLPTEGVVYESKPNKEYLNIIENDLKLNENEQLLRSYQRAIEFMPEEKRLYDVLNYYKSEKAGLYFNQAAEMLEKFKKINDKEVSQWSITDVQKLTVQARQAKCLFQEALYIYDNMSASRDCKVINIKKENIGAILFNIKATDKLIQFLNTVETELKNIQPTPVAKVKKKY